jgi:hypothetical protein
MILTNSYLDPNQIGKKVHLIDVHPRSIIDHLAQALFFETVELSFYLPAHTTQHNSAPLSRPHYCPMPPKETTKTKKWGQADRDLLADLTNRQLIDIINTTYLNIDQVRDLHFWHRDKRNFRRNFREYSAAWDLEMVYSGARCNGGKTRHLIFMPLYIH